MLIVVKTDIIIASLFFTFGNEAIKIIINGTAKITQVIISNSISCLLIDAL